MSEIKPLNNSSKSNRIKNIRSKYWLLSRDLWEDKWCYQSIKSSLLDGKSFEAIKRFFFEKEKELLDDSDICANENIGHTMNNVSDSITKVRIQSSAYDKMKNGSEFAVATTSIVSKGMHDFSVDSKSKISSEIDLISNRFSRIISCHAANGTLVGLVSGCLAAHVHSQNWKINHD